MYFRVILISLISGALGAAAYNYFLTPKFAEVDLFSLIGDERKHIVELLRTGKMENKDIEERVKRYLESLEKAIQDVSREDRVVIFQKGVILSTGMDVTEKVRKKAGSGGT